MTGTALISAPDLATAQRELARMKSALAGWLKYRQMNDAVRAGIRPAKRPLPPRSPVLEQRLATQLAALLHQVMPDAVLPATDLTQTPDAAVQLAQIALGQIVPPNTTPAAVGALSNGVLMAAIIVGGLLLTVTTAIKSNAEAAEAQEHYACIQAGACTDYGFWVKAAALVGAGWLAWTKLGGKAAWEKHMR